MRWVATPCASTYPMLTLRLTFAAVCSSVIVAVLLAFVPIYLANVAFSKRFGASDDSRSAFGLNLLGAMLGGTMEYLALLTGYRNLLLIVAALYLCAFLLTPRKGLVTV